jgi:chemotaxis receptor (MCP) glutamine deamidase CheD
MKNIRLCLTLALTLSAIFNPLNTFAQKTDTCWAICSQADDGKAHSEIPRIGEPRQEINDLGGILVFQQEFATAQARDSNFTLQTVGAGPCITVVFWDSVSQVGAMVHLAHMVLHQNKFEKPWVEKVAESMTKAGFQGSRSTVEIHIIGGQTGSSENLYNYIDTTLRQAGFTRVVEVDFGGYESRNILLDTRSGQVFDLVNIISLSWGKLSPQEEGLLQMRTMNALESWVDFTLDPRAKREYMAY